MEWNENEPAPTPFYKAVEQLKGPGSRTAKFRNYCEIFACTVSPLQNQQKFDLGK